jgi:ATP-dependent Clp protease ATP-binding subunit ClpX
MELYVKKFKECFSCNEDLFDPSEYMIIKDYMLPTEKDVESSAIVVCHDCILEQLSSLGQFNYDFSCYEEMYKKSSVILENDHYAQTALSRAVSSGISDFREEKMYNTDGTKQDNIFDIRGTNNHVRRKGDSNKRKRNQSRDKKNNYSTTINKEESVATKKAKTYINVKEFKAHLDKYIVGSEDAKRTLASTLLYYQVSKNVSVKKPSLLIVGPTGSGKTAMVEAAAHHLSIPMVAFSSADIAPTSYKGTPIESIFAQLIEASGGNIDRAEESGIVFLDEIDKLNTTIGLLVQNTLLRVIEGTVLEVEYQGKKVPFNTTNVLFICSGAFQGIDGTISSRVAREKGINLSGIGLVKNSSDQKQIVRGDDMYKDINRDDVVKWGIKRELVGRLQSLTWTEKITKKTMLKILTDSETSPIKQQKTIFKEFGIELEFSKSLINGIVDEAIKKSVGARGLDSSIKEIMNDVFFHIQDIEPGKLVINKKTLKKYASNKEEEMEEQPCHLELVA